MWRKTYLSFLIGLLLSTSIILNLNYFLPFDVDVKLLVGYILGFLIWAGLMSYFFCFEKTKKPALQCLSVLTFSLVLNVLIKLGVVT